MRLFRGLKKRATDAHYLVLDIGTDSVKALVCLVDGKRVRVLGAGTKRQKVGDMDHGVVTDLAAVIDNCHAAIKYAENMAGIHTHRMIMGISGESVKGATTNISYMRSDETSKIDLAELKNIVHKVQWRAFERVRAQLAEETGYNEIDVKLIAADIVDVKIDGYRLKNPIGFQGKEVSLSVFNAFAPLVHYGALQTIAAEIDKELLAITSEPYALSRCLEGGNHEEDTDAVFVDVGGGITDVVVVKDGVLKGTKMFTVGGQTFTKRLSQSLNISFGEADEIKLAYSNDILERQSRKIVQEAMKLDADVWLSGMALTLEEFDNMDVLPPRIILSGRAANLPELRLSLESREWVQSLPFVKKPQISFFSPKMVPKLIDDTKTLNDHGYAMAMGLAVLGMGLVSEDQVLSKVLKKVVRLMNV
ncbi:hypothetical protein CVV38_02295 [Candidatus Peregrinibacteria bacterium HGW-Peregrinibacteria-1]|jgi:cell division protein FtsA|nr:MAG: hypothetical protein CVV38_02295 [Candidatus Peregrinibacteria bacterium HGW-Peregrinibacteria-1]